MGFGDDVNWGQGAEGAAGGAMAGSFAGPLGAGIGAGVGGLLGLFGGGGAQDYQDQLKKMAAQWAQRNIQPMQNSQFRQNQMGLIAQLEAAARGDGPSAAAIQMREAMDKAVSGQASAAAGAGGRGVNPGAAYLNASNNSAAITSQGARDTAELRAKEQLAARGQLGDVINSARQSDEMVGRTNMMAKLQLLGLNDEAQLKALMAAMQGAGPGLGASLMAGGAQAFPTALKYWMNKNKGNGGFSPDGMQNDQDSGVGNPYDIGAFGNGDSGPNG